MTYIRNEKGIALVMALMLALITLVTVTALLYFIVQGTEMSGYQKRYQTAQEAAKGGVEFVARELIPKTIGSVSVDDLTQIITILKNDYAGINLSFLDNTACIRDKLLQSTVNWTNCNPDDKSFDLKKSDGSVSGDFTITLSGIESPSDFNVYAKIVDTVEGNTDSGGLALEGLGVTESGSGMVTPQHFPMMYRIEVQGERMTNPDERANFSVLYAY
jgi:hypothetical protein